MEFGLDVATNFISAHDEHTRHHFSHLVTDELIEEIVLGDVRRSVRAARRYVDEIRGLYEDICELTNANGGEG